MDSTDFAILSLSAKKNILSNAVYIEDRAIYSQCIVQLFYIHGLFVEVFYRIQDNEIEKIELIEEIEVLDIYLDLRDFWQSI